MSKATPISTKPKKCGVCKERLSTEKLDREGFFITGYGIPFKIMCWDCTVKAVRQLDDMDEEEEIDDA